MTKKPETRIKVVKSDGVVDHYYAQYKVKMFFGLISIWLNIIPAKTSSPFTLCMEIAKVRIDDFIMRQQTEKAKLKKTKVEYIKYPEETKSNE